MASQNSYIMINFRDRIIEMLLSVKVFREKGWYFAECPELDLVDQGKSRREAIISLQQMVNITLIEAFESGNIAAMLKELGFKQTKVPVPTLRIYSFSDERYAKFDPMVFNTRIPSNIECPPIKYTPISV